jgi:hypothetical protein
MANEATKLFASIGADIRDYELKMVRADQIAKQTAASMQNELDQAVAVINGRMSQAGQISAQFIRRFGADAPDALGRMRTASQGTVSDIDLMKQALGDAGVTAESTADSLSSIFGTFGLAMTSGAIISATQKIVKFTLEMGNLDEQARQVRRTFQNITGTNASNTLDDLRETLKGAADDTFLLQSASKLIAMDFADNTTEAADLLSMVTQLGRAFKGLTAEQSVENLLPLLSNQSALRLDEFGVSGAQVKELQDRYEEMGMSSGEAFKRAFIEAATIKLDEIGIQEPTQAEKETTALSNLKTDSAMWFGQSGAGQALAGIRDYVNENAIQGAADTFSRLAMAKPVIEEYRTIFQNMRREGEISEKAFVEMGTGLADLTTYGNITYETLDDLESQIQALISQNPELLAAWQAWEAQIHTTDSATSDLQLRLELMDGRNYTATVTVRQVSDNTMLDYYYRNNKNGEGTYEGQLAEMANPLAYGSADNTAGYQTLTNANIDIANSLSDMRFAAMGTAEQIAALTEERDQYTHGSPEWVDLNTRIINLTKGQASASKSATSALEEQRRALESLADAAFGLSTVTEYDVLATQFGAYDDKPDEYLRRLEDAVNNPDSPYKDFLGGRSGDEAKFYLMQQKEAWQNGRWDQLGPGFRRDESIQAMVDQVTTQYENDQARQAILDEVMSRPEIAALGFTENDVAGIVGLPQDYTEVGADRATALAEGLTSSDTGLSYATTFQEQIKAQEELFKATGGTIAGFVAAGFTAGIDNTTAKDIANALFPYLEKLLNPDSGKRP